MSPYLEQINSSISASLDIMPSGGEIEEKEGWGGAVHQVVPVIWNNLLAD